MQLAPLRPRRRRSADPASSQRTGPAPRSAELSAVAARIAGLIDGPVSEALVVMLTELYGDALARIVATIDASPDGAALIERICDDKLVGGLLVVHDLHPQPLGARVERALSAALEARTLPPCVRLDRIEDDVVYVRLSAAGALDRSAVTRVVVAAAPEIARVCVEVVAEEFNVPA